MILLSIDSQYGVRKKQSRTLTCFKSYNIIGVQEKRIQL